MVKSSARSMFSLMRFNKCKPIKHGELEFRSFQFLVVYLLVFRGRHLLQREGLRMSLLRYVKATLSKVDAVAALVQ